jgi:hypothetical protein
MVTVSDKDGRPWTDMRGQAYLLDSTGQRLAVILLHPLSPGEFRLIAPLGRLNGPGYLDVRLPGRGKAGERRGVYEVNPAGRTVTWVKTAPGGAGDFSVQATGGPDAFGYTWDDAASYAWVDTSGGTSIPSLRDDDWVGPYNIGFTFSFYGQNYTQFYLDSNGYIGFDNTQTQPYSANSRLPSPHRPNSLIAPFWDDLDPSQGGTVRYRTFGSPGSQYLVVEWSGVPRWGTSDAQSFELILYEGSNNIKFQYPSTRQGTGGDLRSATAGIENSDGTIGSEYPNIIPINMTAAVQFNYNRPAYNVFLTPDQQGGSAAAGSSVTFHVLVKNLGANADAYTMSRSAYTGSDWAVSFYQSDGVTPLSGNSTGSIAAGAQTDIVVKVSVPGGASIGDWTRTTVRAQGSGGAQSTATVDVMLTPSFYQMYSDDYSGDGTEDAEIYVGPVVDGASHTQRLTTDQDNSTYPATASTPDGNAVVAWNTNYWNGAAWVSEIEYTVVDRSGSFVRSITRLTNNSAATLKTWDWSPTIAVAPNGNILIAWSQQVDTNGDGLMDRFNARYTIVNSSGGVVKPVTALTNNTSDYPRDYPPSAVALTGGNFLLAWEHAPSPTEPVDDVYYTVLNSNGQVVIKPATRLTDGAGWNWAPRAASFHNGKAAIVYSSNNSVGNSEVYYAMLNADGTLSSALTPITTNGSSASSGWIDATALSDDQLAVAWVQATTNDTQIQYTIVGSTTPTPTYTPTPTPTPTRTSTPSTQTPTPTPTPTNTPTPTPTGGPGWVTIVSEDFESSFPGTGWQVFDNDGATNGEYYWAKKNCKSYAGSYSGWAVGGGANGAALSCGANYPDDVSSWMVYGPFSLADATAADLKFKLWLNSESGYDGVMATASINGANFYGVPISGTTSGGWVDGLLNLGNVPTLGNLMGQSNVWVALIFVSDSSINYSEGAYVDNIVLRKCTSGSCPAASNTTPISGSDQIIEFTTQQVRTPDAQHTPGAQRTPSARRASTNVRIQSPAAPQVIYTVPNELSNANIYVSLAVDSNDHLIMTWLDNARGYHLFYALADKTGANLTPATILQRTRHSFIWSSWNGYGNDLMPPTTPTPTPTPQGPIKIYLPLVIKNYPPPPPVTNGGFESDLASWTSAGSGQLAPAVVSSPAHGGARAAVLGYSNAPCRSEPHGDSSLSQSIQVPSSGSPRLSLYYRIMTYDRLVGDKWDWFAVYINGTLLLQTGRISSTVIDHCAPSPYDTGWQQFTSDLSGYKGQTIVIRLVNHTSDQDFNTWTYVDDVSVN